MNGEDKFNNFLKDKLSDADFKTACKLYAGIFDELTEITGQMFEQASESLEIGRRRFKWKNIRKKNSKKQVKNSI